MYFPIAGIEIHPLLPPLVAFIISFFTSMGGVSGAFLLLPFQMSILGFTSPAVSATNHCYNIVAIPSGVYRYIREGRMVWPLTWVVVIGTLPGVILGGFLRIHYLPDPRHFKFFVALVLLYIAGRMMKDLLTAPGTGPEQSSAEEQFQKRVRHYRTGKKNREPGTRMKLPQVTLKSFSIARIEYEFFGEYFSASTPFVFLLSFVVGIVGGIYGIGGGAIIAPFFVSIFKLPVYTIAGAALMGTFITSVTGVLFFQIIAPFYPDLTIAPDWGLGVLFGLGGLAGMYCGARFQKYVPAKLIKLILVGCMLIPAFRYIWSFFL